MNRVLRDIFKQNILFPCIFMLGFIMLKMRLLRKKLILQKKVLHIKFFKVLDFQYFTIFNLFYIQVFFSFQYLSHLILILNFLIINNHIAFVFFLQQSLLILVLIFSLYAMGLLIVLNLKYCFSRTPNILKFLFKIFNIH